MLHHAALFKPLANLRFQRGTEIAKAQFSVLGYFDVLAKRRMGAALLFGVQAAFHE